MGMEAWVWIHEERSSILVRPSARVSTQLSLAPAPDPVKHPTSRKV